MFRHYFLINVLLLLLIVFLGIQLKEVLSDEMEIPSGAHVDDVRPEDVEVRKANRLSSEASYDVIVSKNLFHPSRAFSKSKPAVSAPPSEKEIPQLFGTIILNEKRMAILQDMSTKKSKMYRVDDTVSGFVVSDIQSDKVVLEKAGESIQVKLREGKKFKPPARIRKTPVNVRKAGNRNHPRRRRTPVRSRAVR